VVFISLGVGLVGVGLAFWKVWNLVMSEDEGGSIDAGTAGFVNLAIHVVGAVMLLQVVLSVSLSLLLLHLLLLLNNHTFMGLTGLLTPPS
jgi:hypothetical protein